MATVAEVEEIFTDLGGEFLQPAVQLQARLQSIEAFIFDWDGVFNAGHKGEGTPSQFAEPDSMGTNLLRYAYWRQRNRLPVCAIVSGADNPTARNLARREHFHAVWCGVADKRTALEAICAQYDLAPSACAWIYDDANDFSAARHCGLRFLVNRPASPLLRKFAAENALADYVTAATSGNYAVREVSELLIGLLEGYPGVFASRSDFDERYQAYFQARQLVDTHSVEPG